MVACARYLAALTDNPSVIEVAEKVKELGAEAAEAIGQSTEILKRDSVERYHDVRRYLDEK
ncbi:hypothetical protein EQZ20_07205 [Bacillus glycinifermentans]|uniref:Uncharacterized protein n=1 Tax=Bacillus glycinifermentans TaxID=1664069 RepID=A0AAJ4D1S4_9BACI|nr:hypothetical protein [Bacillus glycinifermentans]QAT64709.1 hypothetical protein EQZ20_07205 [Bacillus glycinifermentans]